MPFVSPFHLKADHGHPTVVFPTGSSMANENEFFGGHLKFAERLTVVKINAVNSYMPTEKVI